MIGPIDLTNDLFVFLISPSQIVMGGGVSNYFNEFVSKLESKSEIIPARNRNNAGIIGAAISFK